MAEITVNEAVKMAFSEMESQFNIHKLIRRTQELADRKEVTDSTILRALRKAKEKGEIDYTPMDKEGQIYYKVKDWNNPAIKNQLELFD